MSFIYYCIHCSQKIDVDDSLENRAAVCPTCQKSIFLIKTVQGNDAGGCELPQLKKKLPPLPTPKVPETPELAAFSRGTSPVSNRHVPVENIKEYKILQESLPDYFTMHGRTNLEKELNKLAGQGWRVISSMQIGDPLLGAMVFVLERDR